MQNYTLFAEFHFINMYDTHLENKYGIQKSCWEYYSVADPGFPVGGRGPPTWALFGENVCKNERIGSHGGGGVRRARPPRSANTIE